jgi:hypothetical protein
MTRQRLTTLVIALAFAATAVPVALADGPNDDQYPLAATLVKKPKPPANHGVAPLTTKKSSGTLPFTGLDLALVAVLGGTGLVGGVGLRKLGHKRSDT